ncbi:MAG: hypothetical protein EOO47_23910 [Flavobacterium sp.]|nr:MAG: hypothetical protein EOO47_23910 [Flavobacterium sp.]
MNDYEIINSSKDIFISEIHEPFQNELRFIITIGQVSTFEEDVFIGEAKLGPMRRIEINEASPQFTIYFDDYICYNVINESFESLGGDNFIGNNIRIYSNSNFLEYIRRDTFATVDYPGEFKHYCFISHNHLINIATVSQPKIDRIK